MWSFALIDIFPCSPRNKNTISLHKLTCKCLETPPGYNSAAEWQRRKAKRTKMLGLYYIRTETGPYHNAQKCIMGCVMDFPCTIHSVLRPVGTRVTISSVAETTAQRHQIEKCYILRPCYCPRSMLCVSFTRSVNEIELINAHHKC